MPYLAVVAGPLVGGGDEEQTLHPSRAVVVVESVSLFVYFCQKLIIVRKKRKRDRRSRNLVTLMEI